MLMVASLLVIVPSVAADEDSERPDTVLVVVNGEPLRESDLGVAFLLRQLPMDADTAARREAIERSIDRRLIASFLKKRKVEADSVALDRQVAVIRQVIERGDGDFDETLRKLGLDEDSLRATLALPLAWEAHVARTVTNTQIREEFVSHRARYDGTRVDAAHIVITLSKDDTPATWRKAEEKLAAIAADIRAGKLTFAEAAEQHSQSPSARDGGRLGAILYGSGVPQAVADVLFTLEKGEISTPFRSPYGVHIATVLKTIPGDLSLEDARPDVLQALSQRMWQEQVARERAKARIEWPTHRDESP